MTSNKEEQVIVVSSYLKVLCRDYKRATDEATEAMRKLRVLGDAPLMAVDYLKKKELQNEWAEKDIVSENLARKIASCLVDKMILEDDKN